MNNNLFKRILKFYLKPIKIVLNVVFVSINVASYLLIGFEPTSKKEYISSLVSDLSQNTITKSLNIDAMSKKQPVDLTELNKLSDLCSTANYQNTSRTFYNFRTLFNSKANDYLTIDELNNESISILPHTSSGKPHKNKLNENVHGVFEIKLMFDSSNTNTNKGENPSFCYIRKETADKMLNNRGISSPKEEDYLYLIRSISLPVTYVYNGNNLRYYLTIANIILPDEADDPFYYQTFGNYITLCTYSSFKDALPAYDGFSINFDLGSSINDTSRYIDIIKEICPTSDFLYQVNTFNQRTELNKQTVANLISLLTEYSKQSDNVLTIVCVALFSLFIVTMFILSFLKRIKVNMVLDCGMSFLLFFFIYHVFFVLSKIHKPLIVFFTSKSIFMLLLLTFLVMFSYWVISFLIFKKQTKLFKNDNYYKIDI